MHLLILRLAIFGLGVYFCFSAISILFYGSRGGPPDYLVVAVAAGFGALLVWLAKELAPSHTNPTLPQTAEHDAVKVYFTPPDAEIAIEFTPVIHIVYADADGVVTERDICPISYEIAENKYMRLRAWCFRANDTRTFRTDRVLDAIDLKRGDSIENLRLYLLHRFPELLM